MGDLIDKNDLVYTPSTKYEMKPPLTFEQQLEKMTGRNLIVEDKITAIEILKRVNYYRLSAYAIHLKEDDVYLPGTTFYQIYRLYEFDAKLRTILSTMIERIEIAFRTHVAYHLALKTKDSLCYKYSHYFYSERYHAEFMQAISEEKNRSSEQFIKHHDRKYKGNIPIWVLVEIMSLGTLSKLYRNMLREDQSAISKEYYSLKPYYVISWLRCLTYVRNLCAHHARIYNRILVDSPSLFNEYNYIPNDRIFAAILVIKRLTVEDAHWVSFFTELHALIDKYEDVIELSLLGFPDDWHDILSVMSLSKRK